MPKAKLKELTWQLSRTAAKKWGYRNVYALGFSMGIFYIGYYGLVSLQSSINPTIGLISLALLFAAAFFGAFATPTILKLLGTKYAYLTGLCGSLLYTIANFYPSPYTLIPTSIIAGFTCRPLWAAVFNHSSEVAVLIAPVLKKRKEYLISKFSGVVFGMYVTSYIFGNLASSVILYPYNQVDDNAGYMNTSNSSVNTSFYNDTEVCNIDGSDIDKLYVYILTSVYTVCQLISIAITLVFVDRLPSDEKFFLTKKKMDVYVTQPLKDIFSVLKNVRMFLIAPIIMMWALDITFSLGTFTKVYITKCFGTYQVGFTLMVLGATSATLQVCSAFAKILKYIPQFVMVFIAATITFALLSFLLIWDHVPSYAVIFTFAIGWGCADGVWSTQTASLPGILFPKNSATAYGAIQVWMGVGFTLGYTMSEFVSVKGQIYVIFCMATLTSICSFILEVTYLKDSSRLWSCCNRTTSDTKLKLGKVVISLSATNPMVSGKGNSKSSVSSNDTDSGDVPVLKQLNEEKTTVQGSLSASDSLFERSNNEAPFTETGTVKTPNSVFPGMSTLNSNVLNVSNPLPLLYSREEETNSNLCQLVKYSQSYMYALDNAVEMDATGSPNE